MINNNLIKEIEREAVYWDTVNWSKAISFWEDHLNNRTENIEALEIGCGQNGGLSLWLAAKGYHVICSGYDSDLKTAKGIHIKYNLNDRIDYKTIDAKSIPDNEKYDLICFKSVLGGIIRDGSFEIAQHVINQIYKTLKPKGILLFAENLAASKFHSLLRTKYGALKNNWYYFNIEKIIKMLYQFSSIKYKTFGFTGCFGRNEFQRRVLGRIDTVLFDKILPENLHYIISVVAVKK
jgi:2-polyprenyl-3-methyl-5-hydroxy-6-metoxy-1,4-benzoquinol methylase